MPSWFVPLAALAFGIASLAIGIWDHWRRKAAGAQLDWVDVAMSAVLGWAFLPALLIDAIARAYMVARAAWNCVRIEVRVWRWTFGIGGRAEE